MQDKFNALYLESLQLNDVLLTIQERLSDCCSPESMVWEIGMLENFLLSFKDLEAEYNTRHNVDTSYSLRL